MASIMCQVAEDWAEQNNLPGVAVSAMTYWRTDENRFFGSPMAPNAWRYETGILAPINENPFVSFDGDKKHFEYQPGYGSKVGWWWLVKLICAHELQATPPFDEFLLRCWRVKQTCAPEPNSSPVVSRQATIA